MGHGIRVGVLATLAMLSPVAVLAAPVCAAWLDQGDGTSWTTCVDDNGGQTCWRISNASGSKEYQVTCG